MTDREMIQMLAKDLSDLKRSHEGLMAAVSVLVQGAPQDVQMDAQRAQADYLAEATGRGGVSEAFLEKVRQGEHR